MNGVNGTTKANMTTTDNRIKIRFTLKLFFMVTWPGPNTSGMGAQADGVRVAIEEAKPISIANIPMLVEPPFNNATPILKKIVIVTILDIKFVMNTAPSVRAMTTINGFTPVNSGCSTFAIQTLIPVASEVTGVAITLTTPAKMIAPMGRLL